VNSEHYCSILYDIIGLLEEDEIASWFQQDGCTAHTANNSVKLVNEIFGERVISTNLWPPRYPDLTTPEQQTLQCIVIAHTHLMVEKL
jgi:hypothetical protein